MNPTEELRMGMGSMNWPTIMALLDAGADIDVRDKHGRTLLQRAVCQRSMNKCTELLERGASPHIRDSVGWTVWDLLSPDNDNTPLYSLFLQYGVDVNQVDPKGWTALHGTCLVNQHTLILFLLTQGADPRLPILDGSYQGKTAYDRGSFWYSPDGIRERFRWDTISIQEVFILASERGLVPIPSYLW